jgi:hypothetical protein
VTTSEISNVEIGQLTDAANRSSAGTRDGVGGATDIVAIAITAITRHRAREPVRRTRSIDDLPAGRAERRRTLAADVKF